MRDLPNNTRQVQTDRFSTRCSRHVLLNLASTMRILSMQPDITSMHEASCESTIRCWKPVASCAASDFWGLGISHFNNTHNLNASRILDLGLDVINIPLHPKSGVSILNYEHLRKNFHTVLSDGNREAFCVFLCPFSGFKAHAQCCPTDFLCVILCFFRV